MRYQSAGVEFVDLSFFNSKTILSKGNFFPIVNYLDYHP